MPKLMPVVAIQKQKVSFRNNSLRRFTIEIKRIRQKYELNSIVLVVDEQSALIISHLFTITQLVELGVVFFQRLDKVRKSLDHHAIYFITPTAQSIENMLKDYTEEEDRYRKAHVLFTDSLDRRLMSTMASNKYFLKRLARNSFKQFYYQIHTLSDNCIHMQIDSMVSLYSADERSQQNSVDKIAQRFVDMVANYESINTVRFYYEQRSNKVAEKVAKAAASKVRSYMQQLLVDKSYAISQSAPDITFFIVDRSIDVITPFIHGYAYQALLYDLLPQQTSAEQISKFNGPLFEEFRYHHISHALALLPQRLDNITKRLEKATEMNAMEIKQMTEQKQKLTIHLSILHKLWQKFKEKSLNQVGQLQLSLATGVTAQSKQTSSSELIAQVTNLIKQNTQLSQQELIRLAVLAIVCIKMTKDDYLKMLDLFDQTNKKIIKNMVVMGIGYDHKISRSTKNIDKKALAKTYQKLANSSMPSQRHTCALQLVLPHVAQSLQKGSSKGLKMQVASVLNEQRVQKFSKDRMICFMCGDLTQTQICRVRQIKELDGIALAADRIVSPKQLLSDLSKINILDKI